MPRKRGRQPDGDERLPNPDGASARDGSSEVADSSVSNEYGRQWASLTSRRLGAGCGWRGELLGPGFGPERANRCRRRFGDGGSGQKRLRRRFARLGRRPAFGSGRRKGH